MNTHAHHALFFNILETACCLHMYWHLYSLQVEKPRLSALTPKGKTGHKEDILHFSHV